VRKPEVLVIGGGIGGLSLAQRLKQEGIPVTVYERERAPTDRLQGYQIHLNPSGSCALRACLPPELFGAFAAAAGAPLRGVRFVTERLDELLSVSAAEMGLAPDSVGNHRFISRTALWRVLLTGLEAVVRFERTFTRYEQRPDERVVAHFADGSAAEGDVLVGADGSGSRVRRHLLPAAHLVDTGVLGVAGTLPLSEVAAAGLPTGLAEMPVLILARGGLRLFVVAHESGAAEVGGEVAWAFSVRRHKLATQPGVQAADGMALREAVARLIQGWDPRLRRLVEATAPAAISLLPLRTSVPVCCWTSGPVTLLGDAIHSMTPALGLGANTALRDAALLGGALTGVARGERPLLAAIRDYEREMARYGFAAVRDSRRALEQAASDNPVALFATRTALRLLNGVPPLKRWTFRRLGGR
jgi:salicylate hydroxylase